MDLRDVRIPTGSSNDIAIGGTLMEPTHEPDYSAMTSRPAGPLAIVLLAYFVADVIAAAIIRGERGGYVPGVFVFVVVVSQALLLAMWVGLGNVTIWFRLISALAWSLLLMLLGTRELLSWDLQILAAACLMLLLAAAPYGLVKVWGFRISRRHTLFDTGGRRDTLQWDAKIESRGAPVEPMDPARMRPGLHGFRQAGVQFSISRIFGWTALAGIMAVLAGAGGMGIETVLTLAITISIASAIGLSALWAVMGGQQVGARLLAPFGFVVLVSLIATAIAGEPLAGFIMEMTIPLALCTAAVTSVLGLFRSADYRVGRATSAVVVHVPPVAPPSATSQWNNEL
jgi:hypothetical protein